MKQSLEDHEIKGITAKILWYIIYGTATVCFFVVGSYFAIRLQLQKLEDKNIQQDQRMDNIQDQANKQDSRINAVETKQSDLLEQFYQFKK